MRRVQWYAAAAALMMLCGAAEAKPKAINTSQEAASSVLRIFGVTHPPYGFVEFCNRDPATCEEGRPDDTRRPPHALSFAELVRVNLEVNTEIEPATDMEIYGRNEYWTLPDKRGDCEDFALLKRHRLIAAGWPRSALLMTVVLDERGDGHAVLVARTSDGDYVLDNKAAEVKLWNKTPYHFIMRQSYLNPRVWMSLDPTRATPSVPVAGVEGLR